MTNLPNNLYSGGAVTFNSKPYTDFYLQSMAKKRARAEALDNYYRDFNKSINPAGMRNQDIEGWMGKTNDFRSFFQQNKDAILNPRKDNGKSYSEYMGRAQDLQADIQKSKNLGEISKQYVVPVITNPDKARRLHNGSFSAIHAHDLSMYDQNHQELDPSVFDYSAKPFDISMSKKLDQLAMNGVKMSGQIQNVSIDPKTKTRIVTNHAAYSPQDFQTIGGRYADAYSSDDSFANAIDDIVHDQSAVNQYSKVFKRVYGRDIESNDDLAAAYGLSRVQQSMDTQKASSYNPYSPADYEYQREKFWDFAQDSKQDMNNSYIDELVENQKQRAQSTSAAWSGNYLEIPADQATLLALKAEKIHYNPDNGTYIPEWKEKVGKDKDGNYIYETRTGTPMTEMDYKAALGKRDIGSKYFQRPSKDAPKQQTHKSGSSNSRKTIKKSDIANKAAASGYSPEEYEKLLKQNGVKITE